MNVMEIWKVIDEHPDYMISNMGRVKSLKYGKERILKPNQDRKGYKFVNINNKSPKIHRLVGKAFIPNPENKPCIDHINTDRTDNRVENLRWVSNKENCNNHISREHYSISKMGKLNSNSKPVLQFTKDGEFVKKWDCMSDAEQELNIAHSHISRCCIGGKYQRKTAGGYKWVYADDYEKVKFNIFDLDIYKKKVA